VHPPRDRDRSFGLSVGTVLLGVAALLLWRGRLRSGAILGVAGTLLVVFGYLAPAALKWPSAAWWRLAAILGYVNARIILTVAFVLILTPIGLIWRAIGRDPLARRRRRWPGWMPHPERYRSAEHYKRMY
jgi:multisubunit Na+/H+ antiporter MnhB subunit